MSAQRSLLFVEGRQPEESLALPLRTLNKRLKILLPRPLLLLSLLVHPLNHCLKLRFLFRRQ
jgi:hypothetical protein